MKHLRLATPEEIERVRPRSHFTPTCWVYSMDQNIGTPDIAVVRMVPTMDPVFFGERTTDRQKALFIYAMEERMAGMGIPTYFFNIEAEDKQWIKNIESWGAVKVSGAPELQFKKDLT